MYKSVYAAREAVFFVEQSPATGDRLAAGADQEDGIGITRLRDSPDS
jgi:hypothetical protein